ncbi:unnamed protein product [Schistosoma turkestanicum]|nr:unnamed protein product [Schistosoma turkestanicum]
MRVDFGDDSYVAPPGMLSVFPSPFQSAESWIRDRWIFREKDSAKSPMPIVSLKKGLRIPDPVVSASNCVLNNEELKYGKVMKGDLNFTAEVSGSTVRKANRSLPGFQTILQCGKTLDDDTLLGKVDSSIFNTSLDGDEKVNRIFDRSQSVLGKTKACLVDDSDVNKDTYTSNEYPSLSPIHTSNSQHETLHYPSDSPPYMLVRRSRESLEKDYKSSSKQITTGGSIKNESGFKRNNNGHFLMDSEKSQNMVNSENTDIGQSKSNMLNIFYDPLGLETTNWDNDCPVVNSTKKLTNASTIPHPYNGKHNLPESKDSVLDDISTKRNVCMDDTFYLEFLDKNLAGTDSKTSSNFAERCGLNSPTAFVEDMLRKAQKKLNHQYKC